MMEMQELEIVIDREGRVQVRVQGAHGEGCLAVTKNLENAVGAVEDRAYAPEYYEQPVEISGSQEIGVQ
jgi:hypothetical protein